MSEQRRGLPFPGGEIAAEAERAGAEAFCVGEFENKEPRCDSGL